MKKWRAQNRSHYNEYQKKYRTSTPERTKKHAEVCAKYEPSDDVKQKIKEYRHQYYLKNKHKWSKTDSGQSLGL